MLYYEILTEITHESAGQFIAVGNPVHPRRILDSHVLLIGCEGSYPICVGGREYTLTEGTFLLLPAGVEHYGTAPASDVQSHLWCHFDAQTVSVEEMPEADGALILPESGRIAHFEKYTVLFRQMIDAEYSEYANGENRRRICDAYISILLASLSDDCRREKKLTAGDKGAALVERVAEWIRLHACEGIQPADVSEHFGYNGDYLTLLFRRHKGLTIIEYINRRRIDVAKKLLVDTSLRIGEVAARAGFRDEKYFMKLFRRMENITPTEYRRTCARIHQNTY
ncbi:MAG: helix-turn-helix domain-containing protein [Ruminococcaceae bacterium]|nr:helix-turn-helix domain-containing protein [Oscillospiraceae bacterium]